MKNNLSFIFIAALICFGCSSPGNKSLQLQQAASPSAEVIDAGKKLFREKCVHCHGEGGTAGILKAANLQTSKLDRVSITGVILRGKNVMPAFAGQLSSGEVEQITNYVLKLRNISISKSE